MFGHSLETPGEHLCSFLFQKLVPTEAWDRFEAKHLHSSGYPHECRHYFQEALAINMTGRLLLAGDYIKEQIVEPTESSFLQHLEGPIAAIGLQGVHATGALSRLVRDAIKAKHHGISLKLRTYMLDWSRRLQSSCYLCGGSMNFALASNNPTPADVTLDHVWPQFFGGDSVVENLLPACASCNNAKKQNFPSWAGLNVHFIMLGRDPSANALQSVEGSTKFAVHNFAVSRYADRKRVSLKRAYLEVGPWNSEIRFLDDDAVGDFFNLRLVDHKYL